MFAASRVPFRDSFTQIKVSQVSAFPSSSSWQLLGIFSDISLSAHNFSRDFYSVVGSFSPLPKASFPISLLSNLSVPFPLPSVNLPILSIAHYCFVSMWVFFTSLWLPSDQHHRSPRLDSCSLFYQFRKIYWSLNPWILKRKRKVNVSKCELERSESILQFLFLS